MPGFEGDCSWINPMTKAIRDSSYNLPRDGDTADVDQRLAGIDEHTWERTLAEPFFREQRRRAMTLCRSSAEGPEVAVLVSGAARTMTEPLLVQTYAHFFRRLLSKAKEVKLFAFLNIRENENRMRFGSYGSNQGVVAKRERVQSALQAYGLPYVLEEFEEPQKGPQGQRPGTTSSSNVYPNITAQCRSSGTSGTSGRSRREMSPQQFQFVKVTAAHNMMRRDEEQRGRPFDIVIRLRPDLCMETATRFLAFALRRTTCRSLVTFTVHDAIAVMPRWASDAYVNFWRSGTCDLPDAWNATDDSERSGAKPSPFPCQAGGGLETFMLMGGGVLSYNLHHVWERDPSIVGGQATEPKLRRPDACNRFSRRRSRR